MSFALSGAPTALDLAALASATADSASGRLDEVVAGSGPVCADLLTTESGVEFQSLTDQFGFVVDRQNEDELVLPSAPESQLRLSHAERATGTPQDFEEMP